MSGIAALAAVAAQTILTAQTVAALARALASVLPQSPVQQHQQAALSPVKVAPQPTIICMSGSPGSGVISLLVGVRSGTNIVRVRAPGSSAGPVAPGQHIKVVGAGGQIHIIKSQPTGSMSGIAALAAVPPSWERS